jgi:hypothetical protein
MDIDTVTDITTNIHITMATVMAITKNLNIGIYT